MDFEFVTLEGVRQAGKPLFRLKPQAILYKIALLDGLYPQKRKTLFP
jgi:hypothetical protein